LEAHTSDDPKTVILARNILRSPGIDAMEKYCSNSDLPACQPCKSGIDKRWNMCYSTNSQKQGLDHQSGGGEQ